MFILILFHNKEKVSFFKSSLTKSLFIKFFRFIKERINFGIFSFKRIIFFFLIINKYNIFEPKLLIISSISLSIFFDKNNVSLLFFSCIIRIFSNNSFGKEIILEREFSSFESFIPKEDNIIYNFGSDIPINSLKFLK